MKRATTSLPVPDSPVRRTVVSVGATFAACVRMSCHAFDSPTTRRYPRVVSSSSVSARTRSSSRAARSRTAAARRSSSARRSCERARLTWSATRRATTMSSSEYWRGVRDRKSSEPRPPARRSGMPRIERVPCARHQPQYLEPAPGSASTSGISTYSRCCRQASGSPAGIRVGKSDTGSPETASTVISRRSALSEVSISRSCGRTACTISETRLKIPRTSSVSASTPSSESIASRRRRRSASSLHSRSCSRARPSRSAIERRAASCSAVKAPGSRDPTPMKPPSCSPRRRGTWRIDRMPSCWSLSSTKKLGSSTSATSSIRLGPLLSGRIAGEKSSKRMVRCSSAIIPANE